MTKEKLTKKTKKLYVTYEIIIDGENEGLCGDDCEGLALSRKSHYNARCIRFRDNYDISMNNMYRNENGSPVVKFSRCRRCLSEAKGGKP